MFLININIVKPKREKEKRPVAFILEKYMD